MIYKFFKWICSLFGYELMPWKEKAEMEETIFEYRELIFSSRYYPFTVELREFGYTVVRNGFKGMVVIKSFTVSDYGSWYYARACADELCDKLNETLS